jgi:hypothetical protein
VLSGDGDASKIDASTANLKVPDGDDAEGEGSFSVESIAPGPIGSNTLVLMTQIELPLYRGPRSPLDLVTIENIFGYLFEAF